MQASANPRTTARVKRVTAKSGATITADWEDYLSRQGAAAMYCGPRVVCALAEGLRQDAYLIEARKEGRVTGVLPLIHMRSMLFGSFLVSLPYVSWAGVIADDADAVRVLGCAATNLADELDVSFVELRQSEPLTHPGLVAGRTSKMQMRLPISTPEATWSRLKSEVRTQVRKAMKSDLVVEWGGPERLDAFYDVFARNMRDLGTPVFPSALFRKILGAAGRDAELGIVTLDGAPVASCLVVHGPGLTEIPSAASLREHRKTAANSLMYWRAIERAIERGQTVIDFGRSTPGGATYTFKSKWGAEPHPVAWQYYLRRGDTQAMRPDNAKFKLAIKLWQHLPVAATRVLGPFIVRGIP